MGINDTTLKPCPFCGASASMRHGARFSHWVQCTRCGAGHPFAFDTEEGAIAAWNSRAPEEARESVPSPIPPKLDAEAIEKIKREMAEMPITTMPPTVATPFGNAAAMRLCDELIQAAYDADICSPGDLAHRVRKIKEAINANAPFGNAAAMREALEELASWDAHCPDTELHKIASAALSAPARNCDRFEDADAAVAAFRREMRPGNPNIDLYHVIDWLFAKAEGGDHAE